MTEQEQEKLQQAREQWLADMAREWRVAQERARRQEEMQEARRWQRQARAQLQHQGQRAAA